MVSSWSASEMGLDLWHKQLQNEIGKVSARLYPHYDSLPLHAACRYALDGKGKYIRPLLTLASAYMCGAEPQNVLAPALALEWIHTYSLVHDDLPCMDDDDLRRGRATTHKVFDEATALLVGDALLTDAFFILADADFPAEAKAGMLRILARASGGRGMVQGQALDLKWTGRSGYTQEDLDTIHQNKTGRLIEAACLLGAYAAGASSDDLERLEQFGSRIGLVFQIVDDLLDNGAGIGKTPGKDQAIGKLTYLSLMSADAARERAKRLTAEALDALSSFGGRRAALESMANRLLERSF